MNSVTNPAQFIKEYNAEICWRYLTDTNEYSIQINIPRYNWHWCKKIPAHIFMEQTTLTLKEFFEMALIEQCLVDYKRFQENLNSR